MGGQGWQQIGDLALAFALSSLIGLEREWRQKSAGLRTHTLVGFGSALFLLVSKYGFGDVLGSGVVLDPSRVAAQIVSGIGFIGGGLIFVRGDAVRGLTTASVVWMTAAVGMACAAGLALLAILATIGHFIVVLVFRDSRQPCRAHATAAMSSTSSTRTAAASCATSSPSRPSTGSASCRSRRASAMATAPSPSRTRSRAGRPPSRSRAR